jgi:hypothetical protein
MLGISKSAIAERIARHAWGHPHRGVVAYPGPDDPIRRLAAAVLAYSRPPRADLRVAGQQESGQDFVAALVAAALCGQAVCGPSALWLYGLERTAPDPPWLRLPRGCGNATRGAVAVRHGDPTGALSYVQALPVVDIEQSLMDIPGCRRDLGSTALHHYLARKVAAADARRMTNVERLSQRVDEADRFFGIRAVRAVLADLRGELSHSRAEEKAAPSCRRLRPLWG